MNDKALKRRLAGLFRGLSQAAPPGDPRYTLQPLFSEEQESPVDGQWPMIDGQWSLADGQQVRQNGPAAGERLLSSPDPASIIQTLTLSQVETPVDQPRQTSHAPHPPRRDPVLTLLKSPDPADRRQAAQRLAGEWGEWAIDPLLYAAADPDPETAGLALASLSQTDETVTARVLALAAEPASPLHRGAAAYLSHLAGQPLVYIPAGPFLMGSDPALDPLAQPAEQPQHRLELPGYWIGRYPVTVARFQLFLAKSGYLPRGERQFDFCCVQAEPAEPCRYPVVDLAWAEALAYCDWLAGQTGLPVCLPSEAEWEKAARGGDGRRYPWGNQPPTPELCNFHQPTPAGRYSPQGDSPYGCADMAGNVWEWTRSLEQPYPYQPADGREDLAGDGARVVRGLSFNNEERFTRCAFRHSLPPMLHLTTLGFRVVIIP